MNYGDSHHNLGIRNVNFLAFNLLYESRVVVTVTVI
jgi:hypothetical protein